MSLGLFEGFGVELEYMVVDRATLAVRPVVDVLLKAGAASMGAAVGEGFVSDVDVPGTGISWSNELALHVVELKTGHPAGTLAGLAGQFAESVNRINAILGQMGARLMPSAMHPLMDPLKEMRLWPHDNAEIYGAFNRIFGCTGHGWANLQSVHLNLPFADPDEDGSEQFGRLHAAVRMLLPILPAIAASSPVMEGRFTGVADNRLAVYRSNARRVPSVSGRVIPERVFSKQAYEEELLGGIYRDLSGLDPDGLLREEWVNARGAIARFMRNSIEIRVLDVQECPAADVSICAAIVAVLQDIIRERWCDLDAQQAWEIGPLERILVGCIHQAEACVIDDAEYLAALGLGGRRCAAGDLWAHLVETSLKPTKQSGEFVESLDVILREGTLATRIWRALGDEPAEADIRRVYEELCGCLASGRMLRAGV